MYRNFLKQNHYYFFLGLIIVDIIIITLSEIISSMFILDRTLVLWQVVKNLIVVTIFLFPLLSYFGMYSPFRRSNFYQIFRKIFLAHFAFFIIFSTIVYLISQNTFIAKLNWISIFVVISFGFFILSRFCLLTSLRYLRRRSFNTRAIAIIGTGEIAERIQSRFLEYLWTGYRVVAFIEHIPVGNQNDRIIDINGVPVYSKPEDICQWITDHSVDEIWFALPMSMDSDIKELLWSLRHKPIPKRYVPDMFALSVITSSIGEVGDIPILDLEDSKIIGKSVLIKDILDKLLALVILIFISPLMIAIIISIKATSKGPVIFKQKRYGIYGNVFNVYKFRSMKVHDENHFVEQAQKNDSRLTLIGGFLRRTSLDELPQFINVLQGKMSIVGPRPHAVSHNEYYKDLVTLYMQRHLIKPGITGLAQVNGSRGETDTVEKMQKRIDFDLDYIKNWSVFLDVKIIFLTVFKGFLNKNAY
jgi:putative colanic acid biosysnthesis UDP-glucose lipid carrier transferase